MREINCLQFSCLNFARRFSTKIVPYDKMPSIKATIKSTSSAVAVREKRNAIFNEEKQRQLNGIGRIEKIAVDIFAKTSADDEQHLAKLAMNAKLSTPYDCARHINEHTAQYAALALVDGKPWDMHRPFKANCTLKFLYFTDVQPSLANHAYWRSCSFLLGYILETAFTEDHSILLHSWPSSDYRFGSFVYDAKLDDRLMEWRPSVEEYRALSKLPAKDLRERDLPFEPLNVDIAVAEKLFEDNPFKLQQLPSIAEMSPAGGKIPLYRVHDHIDISRGPMISSTAQLGYYGVCAFYPIETKDFGKLCRVQGISVPFTQRVNAWTWEMVCKSARKLNAMPYPSLERYSNHSLIPTSSKQDSSK